MSISQIPYLGVGLSYRDEYRSEIEASTERIDFLEVITEKLFDPVEKTRLLSAARGRPIVCHGLDLSVGTAAPLDSEYVGSVCRLIDELHPVWYSDHLSMTRVNGLSVGHLAPASQTWELLDVVCGKITSLQERLAVPFLLENIAYYFAIPGAEMSEAQFLSEIVQRTGCGLLLDLNNLQVNAKNHAYDAENFLEQIPLDHVLEIHIAGSALRDGLHIDSHGHPVSPQVWEWLRVVSSRAPLRGVVLERDQNIPPFSEILAELEIARDILSSTTRATPTLVTPS